MLVEHAADHRREQLAVADERRLGAREARAGRVDGAADDQQHERRGRGELGEAMLEHELRSRWVPRFDAWPRSERAALRQDTAVDRRATGPQRYQQVDVARGCSGDRVGVQSCPARMTDSWVETTSIGTFRVRGPGQGRRASFATTATSTGRSASTCRTAAWARSTSSSAATTRPARSRPSSARCSTRTTCSSCAPTR